MKKSPKSVESILVASTAHMPSPSPDFGSLRVFPGHYEEVVSVKGVIEKQDVPEWMRPLYKIAKLHDVTYIVFDQDADCLEGVPTYEW